LAPPASAPGADALRRWRTRVRAYLGADRAVVQHQRLRAAGWRTERTVERRFACFDAPAFAPALSALDAALVALRTMGDGTLGAKFGGAACEAILADAWLVYDVIALDFAGLSSALADRAVGAALADVVGATPDSLCIRWQPQGNGRSVLATAIAGGDLEALRTLVQAHGLRLKRATGELLAVLDARRGVLPATPGVVVAVSRATGTQLATLADGAVDAVHFEAGRVDAATLARVVLRALRLRGAGPANELACRVDSDEPFELPAAGGWERLPPAPWLPAA
jgi:hypothetical protein